MAASHTLKLYVIGEKSGKMLFKTGIKSGHPVKLFGLMDVEQWKWPCVKYIQYRGREIACLKDLADMSYENS